MKREILPFVGLILSLGGLLWGLYIMQHKNLPNRVKYGYWAIGMVVIGLLLFILGIKRYSK